MVKRLKYVIIAAALVLGMTSLAPAQFPCPPTHPTELHLGESYCLELCTAPPIGPAGFQLVGPLLGPDFVPILVVQAGCNPASTNCNVDCDPLDPPPSGWILGGYPGGLYPDWYWTGNACINIRIKWNHDGVWTIVIESYCDGCMCLTFEGQFPVSLMNFSAVAGDEQVALNWTTGSESNADYFNVLRDGETVQRVECMGSETQGHHYTWVDGDVVNGRTYEYTLVSVDQGGAREEIASGSATPNVTTGAVTEYALHQNYPNPFNPETQIAFDLTDNQFVTLKVHSLLGQEVATIVSGNFDAGRHVVTFDGSRLASGVYLYTLSAGEFSAAKKLVLLK